jgi:GTP-binding protein
LGTIIEDSVTGELLADLIHDKQEFLLLPGGKGGKGNQHFATSVNRAPRISQIGLPGQERSIRLSLKFIADIGLIGLPNTGKSTLLSRLSMARPKIDRYPFTTLTPNLGVMIFDDERSLVIADIPGLIEGASAGRGLGHRFLKHIERTQLLLHLLDATYLPDQDILGDFESLIHEMEIYNPALVDKPKIVLINKMDIYSAQHRDIKTLRMSLEDRGIESLPISALTGAGIEKLKKIILEKWGKGL